MIKTSIPLDLFRLGEESVFEVFRDGENGIYSVVADEDLNDFSSFRIGDESNLMELHELLGAIIKDIGPK